MSSTRTPYTPSQRRILNALAEPAGRIYRSGLADWCASERTEAFCVNRQTIAALNQAGAIECATEGARRYWKLSAHGRRTGGAK